MCKNMQRFIEFASPLLLLVVVVVPVLRTRKTDSDGVYVGYCSVEINLFRGDSNFYKCTYALWLRIPTDSFGCRFYIGVCVCGFDCNAFFEATVLYVGAFGWK